MNMNRMKMKKILLGAALSSTFVSGAAFAQAFGDTARVISATPLYGPVAAPRRECHDEQITAYEVRKTVTAPEPSGGVGAGTVLGAIVGGVIGHQLGGSSAGRDHGTAAGAIVGGLVGNQVDRDAEAAAPRDVVVDRVPVTRTVQRCNDVAGASDTIVGYDVVYEYSGHQLRTQMPFDPGPQIPVNVEVSPPASQAPMPGPRAPRYRGTY